MSFQSSECIDSNIQALLLYVHFTPSPFVFDRMQLSRQASTRLELWLQLELRLAGRATRSFVAISFFFLSSFSLQIILTATSLQVAGAGH